MRKWHTFLGASIQPNIEASVTEYGWEKWIEAKVVLEWWTYSFNIFELVCACVYFRFGGYKCKTYFLPLDEVRLLVSHILKYKVEDGIITCIYLESEEYLMEKVIYSWTRFLRAGNSLDQSAEGMKKTFRARKLVFC